MSDPKCGRTTYDRILLAYRRAGLKTRGGLKGRKNHPMDRFCPPDDEEGTALAK